MNREPRGSDVDRVVFAATLVIVLGVSLPMMLSEDKGAGWVGLAFDFVTGNFGFLYVWAAVVNLVFVTWIAFGRFGGVKLCRHGEPPDFSTFSWGSMLFCAGMGTGLLYWGTIEWAYYYDTPPFGLEPRSPEAVEWATTYPIFHWGATGWACRKGRRRFLRSCRRECLRSGPA